MRILIKVSTKAVVAYRSLNGSLYESEQECHRHDLLYIEDQKLTKVFRVFEKYANKNYLVNGSYMSFNVDIIWTSLGSKWREIRDELNQIEK